MLEHECRYEDRHFAHLMYEGRKAIVSLLVTDRDGRALGLAAAPTNDGTEAELQNASTEQAALSAYQTRTHIVFLISALPTAENITLARQIAAPVAEGLRKIEVGNL